MSALHWVHAKKYREWDLWYHWLFPVNDLPVQWSLGVSWTIMSDTFTFHVLESQKPFTCWDVLSTVINSQQQSAWSTGFFGSCHYWRQTAPKRAFDAKYRLGHLSSCEDKIEDWKRWHESLSALREVNTPMNHSPPPRHNTQKCVFSDASVIAIIAMAYLKVTNTQGHSEVGFVFVKSKLALSWWLVLQNDTFSSLNPDKHHKQPVPWRMHCWRVSC